MDVLTDSQKLDFLVNAVASLPKIEASLSAMVARVSTLEATVASLQKDVASLRSEVHDLKNRDNIREQERRHLSLRLMNFPGSDSETGLGKKVYDKLLKPILTTANSKGELPTTPQLGTVVVEIHRAGKFAAGAGKPPPPIIIRLASEAVRIAILKNKKSSTPPPPRRGPRS